MLKLLIKPIYNVLKNISTLFSMYIKLCKNECLYNNCLKCLNLEIILLLVTWQIRYIFIFLLK